MARKKDIYYKVNEDTGELVPVSNRVVELEEGQRIINDKSVGYLAKKSKRAEDKTDFIWVKFQYHRPFLPEVKTLANITRLMYFATFCNVHRMAMRQEDIKGMLRINDNQLSTFRKELYGAGVLAPKDQVIYLSNNVFGKGKIETDWDYIRLHTRTMRTLYESCPTTKHKQLGYLFKMIPYVNRRTNILCYTEQEQDINMITFMSIAEFCDKVGYDRKHASRLRTALLSFRIDGELAVGFFDTLEQLNDKGKFVVVNPKLFFGGEKTTNDYKRICHLFEREKGLSGK